LQQILWCVTYLYAEQPNDLQSWGVCLIAQTGLQFDLATPQGKLIATLMAGLAEFERDLLRERVRSGVTAAQARGVVFGRRLGQRVKSDKLAPKVLEIGGRRSILPPDWQATKLEQKYRAGNSQT
jgi:DNA invertase Pin-like site-specific DNA recombinase